MGPGPSLYVAGDNLAGHGKAHLREAADTEFAYPVCSLQLGVRRLDAGTDPVPLSPLRRLLECIHLIPQAKLLGDLQAEVPGGVTGTASFLTVIGSPYGTAFKHLTGTADIAVEDGMKGTALRVVAAQYAVVYRAVSHGTAGYTTLTIEYKEVPACHTIT